MLRWFNKKTYSNSSVKEKAENSQNSFVLDDPELTDRDYEFLFNQLLDGVAHGWHLGKVIKFFNNLKPRTNPAQWIGWLEKFEKKIIYVADPSQKRVGAIMMRFGEMTRSNEELKQLSVIFHRIGKNLLMGNIAELIWEYGGLDLVTEVNNEPKAEIVRAFSEGSALDGEQIAYDDLQELGSKTPEREFADLAASLEDESQTLNSEGETLSLEVETAISDLDLALETLTEQLTILQDNNPELELINKVTSSEPNSSEEPELSLEQPEQSLDETQSESFKEPDSIASLEALTEQLTILQNNNPESHSTAENPDSEITLVASETVRPDPSTPLSVASFLEAAKALAPQPKKNVTPITWEEFIAVLEQDETLATQVARHLQIASTNPNEILQVIVERFTQNQNSQIAPETVELVQSWFKLGLKQASTEDFQGAIASWDKALKLNSNLSEAWHNRGSALGRLKQYEAAIQSFNKAISITPKRYQAWNDRAHALYQIKKWQQAVESWDKAISLMPDNYQFWYNRGCALEQLQRFDESISSYEKTLEIKPDFQPARSRYINLVTENSSSSSN